MAKTQAAHLADPLGGSNENGECGQSTATLAVSVYTQQSTATAAVFPKHFENMYSAEQINELGG